MGGALVHSIAPRVPDVEICLRRGCDLHKYRSVILGCGPRGVDHVRAYDLIERGELVAACDKDQARLDGFCSEFGVAGYTDLKKMIRQERPDLIHLVVPPSQRYELMEIVSECSVPACLVEKPIACGVVDLQKLRVLERQSRTKFATNHQVRFQRNLRACRDALASGRLGEVTFLDFSAGMNISGQGTHILDWAMFFNHESPIIRVYGTASDMKLDDVQHPAPDTTLAQVTFLNGVQGMWNNGYTARRLSAASEVWKHLRIAGYAEQGRVLFEEFGQWEIVSFQGSEQPQRGHVDSETWQVLNDEAQARLVGSVYDWLEDDSQVAETHLARSLHQWEVVLALYASTLWRKPVDLPFDPPEDLMQQLQAALTQDEA